MRGSLGSPLRGTGTRDVPAVALDALAVLLLVLSLTPAASVAVGSVLIIRETPNQCFADQQFYRCNVSPEGLNI